MEILALLIIVYACRQAIRDTGAGWRKSRDAYTKRADRDWSSLPKHKRVRAAARHDFSFGLAQLLTGFPLARHGFGEGWHKSRKAHHEAMVARQKAKTEHLESRAGLKATLDDYRARQKAAREGIRGGGGEAVAEPDLTEPEKAAGPADPEPGEEGGEGASEGRPASYSYGSIHRPNAWPTDDEEVARREAAYWSQDGTPQQVHRYHGETPGELIGTYVDGKEVSPEEGARLDEQYAEERDAARRREAERDVFGFLPSPTDPLPGGTTVTEDHWDDPLPGEEGSPEGTSPEVPSPTPASQNTTAPSTEGSTPMADTSFAQIDADAQRDHVNAEQSAAAQQQAMAQQENAATASQAALDQTNASVDAASALDLDPETSAAMMEHAEAAKAAKEAHDESMESHQKALAAEHRVMETAQNVRDTLQRNHGLHQQAHDDSPVGSAQSEFYAA